MTRDTVWFELNLILLDLQIKRYEKMETVEERRKLAREIYDNFIMKELLSHTHVIKKPFDMLLVTAASRLRLVSLLVDPSTLLSSFFHLQICFKEASSYSPLKISSLPRSIEIYLFTVDSFDSQ